MSYDDGILIVSVAMLLAAWLHRRTAKVWLNYLFMALAYLKTRLMAARDKARQNKLDTPTNLD